MTRRVLDAFASTPIKVERRSKICCNTLAASGTAAGGGVRAGAVATGGRASLSVVVAGPFAPATGSVGIGVTGDSTEAGRLHPGARAPPPPNPPGTTPVARGA